MRRRGSCPIPRHGAARGFTLIEVLVALVVVALGLTALMAAVSGTARTSGYLRDKTIAQWIALNRLAQVRLTVNRLGSTGDTAELDFANRKWHYDTRYFDTSFPSMKRVVVRVYPGDAKTKGNPIAESTGFIGSALGLPGMSNVDWTQGSTLATAAAPCTSTQNGTGGSNPSGNLVQGAPPASNCVYNGSASASPGSGFGSGQAVP
ncbi:MAG TPA: type II secretion system minor pseudopilin GspI [Steroidobacteraceae bacterium]|nr:type II secretion system minor pseudopilin GspI [Steroidobacteraceae bacterium]